MSTVTNTEDIGKIAEEIPLVTGIVMKVLEPHEISERGAFGKYQITKSATFLIEKTNPHRLDLPLLIHAAIDCRYQGTSMDYSYRLFDRRANNWLEHNRVENPGEVYDQIDDTIRKIANRPSYEDRTIQ